jgi:hemoglobin-like flavoprotein
MYVHLATTGRINSRSAAASLHMPLTHDSSQQRRYRLRGMNLSAVAHNPLQESIQIVQTTWSRAVQQRERIGEMFYERLFTLYPELQSMFRSDPALQRRRLVDMVDAGVSLLNKRGDLESALRDLGKRHVRYGTQEEQYPIVGDNLLQVLESILGADHFTEKERKAWQDVYEYWASVMLDGAREST